MGKASSKHKVDKPELVLELFKKAGHTRHIKPGHVLIEQGKESESLFLVVSGELVLKREPKNWRGAAWASARRDVLPPRIEAA